MGGLWLSLHLWEHYAFGGDTAWLRATGYPLMKGAAEFALDWLVEGPDGFLVTAPSTSPENEYKTPDGYVGVVSVMTTADLALIRAAFLQRVAGGGDARRRCRVPRARSRRRCDSCRPTRWAARATCRSGMLDWDDQDPQHRHVSHLIGAVPGRPDQRRSTRRNSRRP